MNDKEKSKEQLINELVGLRTEISELKEKIPEVKVNKSASIPFLPVGEPLAVERSLLSTLVELLPSFVYVKDLSSRFILVNEACARFMGATSSQELIGKTDADFYPVAAATGFRLDEEKVLKGIPIINNEDIRILPDGKRMVLLTSKVPLRNDEGKIIGLAGNSIDITDRKLAEEKLKSSEEWFRSLFEQSGDGIFFMTFDGKLIAVNSSFASMHGYTLDELLEMNIHELEYQQSKQQFSERVELVKKGEKLTFDVEHFHKDGHRIPLEVTAAMVTIGDYAYIIASHRDISERNRTAESLRISEENFRILFDDNPFPTLLSELPTGSISFINKRMATIMGRKPEEVIGKTPNDFRLLKNPEEMKALIRLITNQGFVDNLEVEKILPDGSEGTDLIFMRLVTINGKIQCLTVIQDISDRKKAEAEILRAKEAAEESDRLKSAFLGNMSHEIRTPMNGILGFAELLKNKDISLSERYQYVDFIEKSGLRMLNVLNDLIDISKIEAGQMGIKVTPFNLNMELVNIHSFFRVLASGKGLIFTLKDNKHLSGTIIRTDREKVNSILTNLIRNAIKFTDTGSIEFGFERNRTFIEFFVRDTGIGVAPEMKDIIFERFRQGSESLARNYEGAGLGLSISKAYVEMLGGKIRLESTPGKGSVFYFTIPYEMETGQKSIISSGTPLSENQVLPEKLKILIAEDDETSFLMISRFVRSFAGEILKAATGTEAVTICRNTGDLDLVLMDIKMPEMNGYEATKQIRQFNNEIIIIAQTAFALLGDKEKAIDAGCNDYISKPIRKAEIEALINKYFNIRAE